MFKMEEERMQFPRVSPRKLFTVRTSKLFVLLLHPGFCSAPPPQTNFNLLLWWAVSIWMGVHRKFSSCNRLQSRIFNSVLNEVRCTYLRACGVRTYISFLAWPTGVSKPLPTISQGLFALSIPHLAENESRNQRGFFGRQSFPKSESSFSKRVLL